MRYLNIRQPADSCTYMLSTFYGANQKPPLIMEYTPTRVNTGHAGRVLPANSKG